MKIKNLIHKLFEKLFSRRAIYYINGPETLPPPLSAEREAELLSIGDEQSKNELIVHNLRLVVYIARKFDTAPTGIEDLISIGTIGLIKAVNTFCPERNIKLATYASRCIENERHQLKGFVNDLPPRERQIMEMRFGMNGYPEYTQKQVADTLGISQSYISRLEKRIIVKLKKQIEKAV